MKLIAAFLLCTAAALAQTPPDWQRWEPYAKDLLQRYIRVPSINPPADMTAAVALLSAEYAKHGVEHKTLPTAKSCLNLLARLPGKDRSGRPLVLMNHMDVVPVDRDQWPVDPFGGIEKDGSIWGRGSLDMKGIGVMQMVSVFAMKQAGAVPPRDIVVLHTCDEETGGKLGAQGLVEQHWQELNPQYVLDEGGLGTRDVFSKNRLMFGISVAEKQVFWLKLRAQGTAAHGSQPIPDNANLILLEAIRKAMEPGRGGRANAVVELFRKNAGGPLEENKFTSAIQRNTMSLTTLRSGVGDPPKANVIPSLAEATLDCRLLPGVNADEFLSEMKARINDPRVSIEVLNHSGDTAASEYTSPFFRTLASAFQKHHPGAVVTPMLVPYGTDSVKFRQRGVNSYGFMPMVLDTKILATMHSDAERIPTAEFLTGLRIYYDVLASGSY